MEVKAEDLAGLVRRVCSGDMEAFEELYNRTNQAGYAVALKIIKDTHEAQDILHDSYVSVLENIRTLHEPEKFQNWFNQIVANKSRNALIKKKPLLFSDLKSNELMEEYLWTKDENICPEASIDQVDVRNNVMELVDNLSDEKRLCVMLYYYSELSIKEIAQIAQVSENVIKARLFQARKDIRTKMQKWEQEKSTT